MKKFAAWLALGVLAFTLPASGYVVCNGAQCTGKIGDAATMPSRTTTTSSTSSTSSGSSTSSSSSSSSSSGGSTSSSGGSTSSSSSSSSTSSSSSSSSSGGSLTRPGMTLTFTDEFDGPTLDLSKWTDDYVNTNATINNELQAYVPDAFEQLSTGALRIKGLQRTFAGKSYTSGAITSYTTFAQTYGYFVMRAKIPSGQGLWPAFWLLAQDMSYPPEIDVFENLGQEPNKMHTTFHWDSGSGHQQTASTYTSTDIYSNGYHTYAIEWRPGLLIWTIDDVEVHRFASANVPAKPMYMLANLAIGGSWPGAPDNTTPFPANFDIDYIRAYQIDGMPAATPAPFTWGVTTLDKTSYQAGDTVTLIGSVKAGNTGMPGGTLHFQVCNYYVSNCSSQINVALSAMAANSTQAFTVSFPLPFIAQTDGVYPLRTDITMNSVYYHVENIVTLVTGDGDLTVSSNYAPPATAISVGTQAATAGATRYPPAPAKRAAAGITLPIGKCLNLAGQLDNNLWPGFPGWMRLITNADFADMKTNKGFSTVRFPVEFTSYTSATAPYTIDPTFLAYVKQTVDAALAAGLNVILDDHNHDEMFTDHSAENARFVAIWQQLATTFQSYPPNLYFELLNEPRTSITNSNLASVLTPALNVIRQTNPTRAVIIGGDAFSDPSNLATFNMPNDPYVVPEIHYYNPVNYTHQGYSWTGIALGATFGSAADYTQLDGNLTLVQNYINRTGRVPFVGEYGASEHITPMADRAIYYDAITHAFASIGVPTCV